MTKYLRLLFTLFIVILAMNKETYAQDFGKDELDRKLSKAEALISEKKYDEAESVIHQCIQTSQELDLYSELSIANYLQGDVFKAHEDYEAAYQAYYNSYSISQVSNDVPNKFEALYRMGDLYIEIGHDYAVLTPYMKALDYFEKCADLNYAHRTHKYQILLNQQMAEAYYKIGEYKKSKYYYGELLKYSRQQSKLDLELLSLNGITNSFVQLSDYENAIAYEHRLIQRLSTYGYKREVMEAKLRIANYYRRSNKNAEAVNYYNLILSSKDDYDDIRMNALLGESSIEMYSFSPNYDELSRSLDEALQISIKLNDRSNELLVRNRIALMYHKKKDLKQAKQQIQIAIDKLPDSEYIDEKLMIYSTAIEIYSADEDYGQVVIYQNRKIELLRNKEEEQNMIARAEHKARQNIEETEGLIHETTFVEQIIAKDKQRLREKDRAYQNKIKAMSADRLRKEQKQEYEKQMIEQELENKKLENEIEKNRRVALKAKSDAQQDSINALRYEKELLSEQQKNSTLSQQRKNMILFSLISLLLVIVVIVFFFSARRANAKLKEQNLIIAKEHRIAEETLVKLKETQSQLLESERLASLGQLTAGIAHEIRNPLNFVNNFSKLNLELTDELKEELKEHINDTEVVEDLLDLAQMIDGNSQRIVEHGERAARIVKQMLDSSRKGAAVLVKTDINTLLEESTKLAYQGARGKEIDFMADLKFEFDDRIGKQMVVSHDLGRVIINLVTNSCHAVLEKQKQLKDFKPVIKVSSKDLGDHFEITVEDNGKGMSEELKSKIFDPFFTTKPQGVGTGLGLTMSFDIINKEHKGSISVDSKENEFTRFTMTIPKDIG